jgi:hypothetical protein
VISPLSAGDCRRSSFAKESIMPIATSIRADLALNLVHEAILLQDAVTLLIIAREAKQDDFANLYGGRVTCDASMHLSVDIALLERAIDAINLTSNRKEQHS